MTLAQAVMGCPWRTAEAVRLRGVNRADDRARARRPWIVRRVLLNPYVVAWALLISVVLLLVSFVVPLVLTRAAVGLFAVGVLLIVLCAVAMGCDSYGSARSRSTGVAGSAWAGLKSGGRVLLFWLP